MSRVRVKVGKDNVYTLKTVEDLLRVPPEKLRHLLYDFELWLRMLDADDAESTRSRGATTVATM